MALSFVGDVDVFEPLLRGMIFLVGGISSTAAKHFSFFKEEQCVRGSALAPTTLAKGNKGRVVTRYQHNVLDKIVYVVCARRAPVLGSVSLVMLMQWKPADQN